MPYRIDTFKIDGKPQVTAEGFLRVDAVMTRSGVFRYRNMDGTDRYELRPDEEVFGDDSLNTLKMVPMTNNHPVEGLVTAQNARQLSVGFTGQDIRKDKPFVRMPVTITDAATIADIQAGKREVSCGYFCDCSPQAGKHADGIYTHVQRNIRYNHAAIVMAGRAGSEVRLKMDSLRLDGETDVAYRIDSEEEVCPKCNKKKLDCTCKQDCSTNKNPIRKDGKKMPVKVINGIQYEAAQEVINHCDAIEKALEAATKQVNDMTVQHDAQKARADKAEGELKDLPNKIALASAARRSLETEAKPFLAGDVNIDSMDDMQIRKAVIAAKLPTFKVDGLKDGDIETAYKIAISTPVISNPASFNSKIVNDSSTQGGQFNADEFDPLYI